LTPEGQIAAWSPKAEQLTGYRADEIIGQKSSVFFSADDARQGKPEQLLRIAATQGGVHDQGWRVRKDGTQFWANFVIAANRDEAGALRGFINVMRDVTRLRRTDDILQRQIAYVEHLRNEQRELIERLVDVRQRLEIRERGQLPKDQRARLASELHDDALQVFFAIGVAVRQALAQPMPELQRNHSAATLEYVGALAQYGAEHLRNAILALDHSETVERDLVPTLRELVQSFRQRTHRSRPNRFGDATAPASRVGRSVACVGV
jgi:PAS domain S-box-containing protein